MGTEQVRKNSHESGFDQAIGTENGHRELIRELPHIFATVREPLLILNGSDLRVQIANPSFYKCFQVAPDDTVGRSIFELGNGQWNIPTLRNLLEKVLPLHESFENFEVEHGFEQIGRKWMLLNARKINDGRLILLAIEDVTFRRQMEEKLQRSNRELEQFAQIASHDLKEPLRMVTSYLRLLKKYLDTGDGKAAEYFNFAHNGANRMGVLIENLLAYSTIGKRRKIEKVHLSTSLGNALTNLDLRVRESDAVITHDVLPVLTGDSTEFVQLFQNLLSNAIKYRGTAPPKIHVSAQKSGNEWRFAVRDNGMGIRSEDQNRIFEMFHRLHSRHDYPGVGIGLPTCKKIVESHGGRIWVESAPDRGSMFFFTIPETANSPA